MIAWYDLLIAGCFWALFIYHWRPTVLRQRRWSDRRVAGTRFSALFMAISLSFQIDPIAAQFDSLVGINNLSWVVGYLNAVTAIYAGVVAIATIRLGYVPRWLTVITIIVGIGFVLIAPQLVQSPEELHDQLPKSLWALMFRELLYGYLLCVTFFGFRTFHEWMKNENVPTGRLRGVFLLSAFGVGFFFCVLRGGASLIAVVQPEWQLYSTALTVSSAILVACIVSLAFGLAPVSLLRIPAEGLVNVQQHLALRDLERLHSRLVPATGDLPWALPPRRARWTNLPFVLYCTVIDILDRRSLLLGRIARGAQVSASNRTLAEKLERLPEVSDWVELMQHLRQIARQV